jgi:hypothetical protein
MAKARKRSAKRATATRSARRATTSKKATRTLTTRKAARGGTDEFTFVAQSTAAMRAAYDAASQVSKQEHQAYMTVIKNLKA